MAHAAVAPIEQRQSPLVAAKITWMEVAMDQRVPKAAAGHLVEPTGEPAHETRQREAIFGGDFVTRSVDYVGYRSTERGPAPIWQSQGQQFHHSVTHSR